MIQEDSLIQYKLIVLYMLGRAAFQITKSQIADFILEQEYTDFLTLQQVFAELDAAGMITSSTIRNRTHLALTKEGQDTLSFFEKRLSEVTRKKIDEFFRENEMKMRNEVSIISDYYKSTSGEYEVHLVATEKKIKLVDITMSVPDEETASAICDNWQKKNQAVYQSLIEQLF